MECPLTKKVMVDPVVAEDGLTYERVALQKHLNTSTLSPVTQEPISRAVVENKLLLKEIFAQVKSWGTVEQADWMARRKVVKERRQREQKKQAKELFESGEYEAAGNMGNANAQNYLGSLYFEQEDYAAAKTWWAMAAEQENVDAIYWMGVLCEKTNEPDEAIEWYLKCVDTVLIAPTNLANLYKAKGDDATAFTYYMVGAKKGYACNMRDVAECYNCGMGVAADADEAGKWYKKAAEKGCAQSRYEMGRRYVAGVGGPVLLSEGLRFMELAAKCSDEDPGGLAAKEKAQLYLKELTDMMARL